MESIPEYDHHVKGGGGKPPWQPNRADTLKQAIAVAALTAIAIAGLWWIIQMIQNASGPQVINKLKSEAVSPDGKWRAVTILHVGPPGLFSGVLVQKASGRADPDGKPILYAQEFELPLRVRWDGPAALTVFTPSDAPNASIQRQVNEYQGIKIHYESVKMLSEMTTASESRH